MDWFDGLLRPGLKDNMGISGDDTGARIVGAMVKAKGELFVKKLKEQNIRMHMMAGSALTQLVAAGGLYAHLASLQFNEARQLTDAG